MANVRASNTWYVDATTPELEESQTRVMYIVLTPTGSSPSLSLVDRTNANCPKLQLSGEADGPSIPLSFEHAPLLFEGGIKVDSITDCVATIVTVKKGV